MSWSCYDVVLYDRVMTHWPTIDMIMSTSEHWMSVKNGSTSSKMIILSRLSSRRSMHSRAFSRVYTPQLCTVIIGGQSNSTQGRIAIVFARSGTLAQPDQYDWTCASFGPPESTTQTANWSIQPFLHSKWQCRRACSGMSFPLRNAPWHGRSWSHLIHLHWAHPTQ